MPPLTGMRVAENSQPKIGLFPQYFGSDLLCLEPEQMPGFFSYHALQREASARNSRVSGIETRLPDIGQSLVHCQKHTLQQSQLYPACPLLSSNHGSGEQF